MEAKYEEISAAGSSKFQSIKNTQANQENELDSYSCVTTSTCNNEFTKLADHSCNYSK